MNTLAAISGEGLVWQLFAMLIIGICALAIWWVGKWFIAKLGGPPMAITIWAGLFILLGLIVVLNFLLSLIGYPIVDFRKK